MPFAPEKTALVVQVEEKAKLKANVHPEEKSGFQGLLSRKPKKGESVKKIAAQTT